MHLDVRVAVALEGCAMTISTQPITRIICTNIRVTGLMVRWNQRLMTERQYRAWRRKRAKK